jgi:hypothetical protein
VTVTTVNDESNGLGVGGVSLREAIDVAGTLGFDPVVNFASNLNGGTIPLTLGEIQFSKSLTIDASMLGNGITIDAGHGTDTDPNTSDGIRIFNITDPTFGVSPPLVTLKSLTLTGGDVSTSDNDGQGGAIRSAGRLVIDACTFVDNAGQDGGAIYSDVAPGGTVNRTVLDLQNSYFEQNAADSNGGAIEVRFLYGEISPSNILEKASFHHHTSDKHVSPPSIF